MTTTEQRELVRHVKSLGPWFHNLDLRGVQTAPDHFLGDHPRAKWQALSGGLPNLQGKTVLDVGCNAGFHSFEALRRGASRVLGLDHDPRYLEQARFAAKVLEIESAEFRELDVYNLDKLGETFDFVMFMGVLYHLRHPLLALDKLSTVVKGHLLFQSLTRGYEEPVQLEENYDFQETDHFSGPGYPKLHFVEHRYAGDPTNWWIPNRACTEAMLRSAGFRIDGRLSEDTYLCAKRSTDTGEGAANR